MPTFTTMSDARCWHLIADSLAEAARNAGREQDWQAAADFHKGAQEWRERARRSEVAESGRTIVEWEWPNPIDGWNDPACPICGAGPDSLTPIAEDSDIHLCEECDEGAVVFTI